MSRFRGLVVVVSILTLAATACSGDDSANAPRDPAAAADAALDAAQAGASLPAPGEGSSTTSTTSTTTTSTTTTVPGIAVNENTLGIDQCFNRDETLSAGRPRTITTLVDCDDPHGYQIFSNLDYPADDTFPYPGDDIMEEFALAACYQRFELWADARYETSALEIGVFTPNRQTFEEQSYRRILCWVERRDGEPLIGTARRSGL